MNRALTAAWWMLGQRWWANAHWIMMGGVISAAFVYALSFAWL